MRARAAGDAALLVEPDGPAAALAGALRAERIPGVLDAVAGARTVLVMTEPGSWDLGELAARVAAVPVPRSRSGWPGARRDTRCFTTGPISPRSPG